MVDVWVYLCFFFFFKQKTAYEMRISDWSSDVCSSDLSSRLRYEAFRSRRYARFSTPWTSSLHRISKPFDSLRRGVDARICFLFVLCQLLGGYRASGPRANIT